MIVREILERSASWLDAKGFSSARLEAELLLAHVLDADRVGLYTDPERPLVEGEIDRYRDLLKRRATGEPVAYLTGEKEFYSLSFAITRDVLVPRPETELLVDRAREIGAARLLDLGTGSGCIAIACARHLRDADVTGTDLSAAALAVAAANAARHGVEIRFLQGDLFSPLEPGERFDLIVSNPPYVAVGDAPEVVAHEPKGALLAGPEGLDVLERLTAAAPEWLAEGGTLLAEIGEDQGDAVAALARRSFSHVEIRNDLGGLPRILEAR